MVSMRISRILNLLIWFMTFATACAIVVAIWIAMGIVLHWLLPAIDLGMATIICSLAFVFMVSVISIASGTSFISSLRDAAELGEEFDDEDDEDDEDLDQELTRPGSQKTKNPSRAVRRWSK